MVNTLARSSFIGRQSARAFLREVLVNPDVRFVTISGPGGIGKTLLARTVMSELSPEFVDGAEFIPLGELRDPDLVLVAITRACGMPPYPGSPLERLCSRLADADILLGLDNLERGAAVLPDLVRLLDACPWVTILATSRTPLHLEGEYVFPLPPLQTPDLDHLPSPEDLPSNEAVELLVRRAAATDPEFALTAANAAAISDICVRLEGIPLAIELAAAQPRAFSPAVLPERLSMQPTVLTRDDWQGLRQTLHTVIAWSDRRLSPASRAVFYALSMFANGSDAAAIEAICGDSPGNQSPSNGVPGALTELVDHGLLQRDVVAGDSRFTMSETIREYAQERLEATGRSEATHRRHALYFLELAEEWAAKLLGPDQETYLAQFDLDHQNFCTALQWSLAHTPAIALRLAAELWRFFYARGCFIEGQRWLEDALATPEAEKSIARVRALNGLGVMVWDSGNFERALDLQNTSLSLAREIGDAWGMAAAQGDRAIVEFMSGGEANQARKATVNVLKQFRALGDRYSEGVTLATLGSIAQSQGKLVRAAHHLQEALTVAHQCGDCHGQVLCLFNLGQIARLKGDLDRSAARHHEGLSLAFRLGLQEDMLYGLAGIAGIAVERGHFKRAARLLGAIPALADWMGISFQPMVQAQLAQDIATTRAAVSEELFSRAWEAGSGIALEDAATEALELALPSDRSGNGHGLNDRRGKGYPLESPHASREVRNVQPPISHEPGEPFRNPHGLSQRELEVLPLLAAGSSDREIAEQLFISCQTATTHVKHIRAKLAVNSRAAAAAYAIRHGIA